jgi:hypothetical protein
MLALRYGLGAFVPHSRHPVLCFPRKLVACAAKGNRRRYGRGGRNDLEGGALQGGRSERSVAELRTRVRDRGHLDLVTDPGSRDLVRDGAHRDLIQGKGLQDLTRDLGLQESLKVGALLAGKLRDVPASRALPSLPTAVLFERLPPSGSDDPAARPPAYLPMIGPAFDRGGEDILRDPGRRDLERDGTRRDLLFAPGAQDRVRDRGAQELVALGAIRSGTLPGEISLARASVRSGGAAVRRSSPPPTPAAPTRRAPAARPSREGRSEVERRGVGKGGPRRRRR